MPHAHAAATNPQFIVDLILVFVVLTNLTLLASSRISSCIKLAAAQGMALGLLPLFMSGHAVDARLLLIAIMTFFIKGMLLPRLLERSLREAHVRHEIEPVIGHAPSVLIGVLLLALSFWLTKDLVPPHPIATNLVLPLALSTILIGLFTIVIRRKALTQVIGYLLMENGIYIFGIALAHDEPLLVEMGVLLDVFVAVFVMGIAIFHINRAFDHIDVEKLKSLKD
jgi:hydrogenase-4 component E